MLRPGFVGVEDEVLHGNAAVRRQCLSPTAEERKHVADCVQYDDVVAGAKALLEHISSVKAFLC